MTHFPLVRIFNAGNEKPILVNNVDWRSHVVVVASTMAEGSEFWMVLLKGKDNTGKARCVIEK